ncbi:MAG: hypothetical protein NTX05_01720 [Fusobacteria bacterium]|nr:hypothetical protein [Fusobacteriota bacterium]
MTKKDFEHLDYAQLKLIRHELEEGFKDELFTLGNNHYTKHLYRHDETTVEFDKNIEQTMIRLDDIIKSISAVEEQLNNFQLKMDDISVPVGAMLN